MGKRNLVIAAEDGIVSKMTIIPGNSVEDIFFSNTLRAKILAGIATIKVVKGQLVIVSQGLKGEEKWEFEITDESVRGQINEYFTDHEKEIKVGTNVPENSTVLTF